MYIYQISYENDIFLNFTSKKNEKSTKRKIAELCNGLKLSSPTFFYNDGKYLTFGCDYNTDFTDCITEIVNKG